MACGRRCRTLSLAEEKKAMIRTFMVFNSFQAILVIILCFLSIDYFHTTNFSDFFSVDLITLLMSVVMLALIVIVVGWASAVSNATFAWVFFHLFMVALLLIEVVICFFTSEFSIFMRSAADVWNTSDDEEKRDLQTDLHCCGLANITDRPVGECPNGATSGCLEKLEDILTTLKNTASVAMFVCFVLGLFIDFAGCSICFHPDVVTLADHEREMADIAAHQMELDGFSNPFES